MGILSEILEEQEKREKLLTWRYPWFNVFYNYLVAIVVIALSVSLYAWGINVWTNHKAAEQASEALAAYRAEQALAEEAKLKELKAAQASEEAVVERESQAIAKAYFGISRFIEKYRYDESDLKTYARCVFNRVDSGNGVNSVEVILGTPEQFLAYSDKNPVLDEFYQIAKEAVTEWHTETVKPCDSSYRYAELTENGIYLCNVFGADGYARRWHA